MEVLAVARAPAIFLMAAMACFGQTGFALHSYHAAKLGRLDCNFCHLPAAKGSVELKRPSHAQCMLCHAAAFQEPAATKICVECHTSTEPGNPTALKPYPPGQKLLTAFSHGRHMDPRARIDPATGVRAD